MRRYRYRITPGKKHRDGTALLRLRISRAGNRIDYAPGIAVDLQVAPRRYASEAKLHAHEG